MKTMKTKDIVFCAVFAALTAIGAFLKVVIPPFPVVFSMQTFFVALAGLILGAKKSAVSVGVYVLLGLLGIPVFTSGGGISYVLQPTFGYILGFIIGAYACGKIAEKKQSFLNYVIAGLTSLVIVYFTGTVYFYLIKNLYMGANVSLWFVVLNCSLVFIPFDAICTVLAAFLALRIKKSYKFEEV